MGKYFGTDGIRGVANDTLTLDTAFKVGRFLGNYVKKDGLKKICIGKDTRLSSSMLENMLAAGISASGSNAYLIGYCSTPALAYVAEHDNFDLGIMISASHNPYYDNGIKVFSNNGIKLSEEKELKVEEYIDNPEGIELCTKDNIGNIYEYKEGLKHYIEWIENLYPTKLNNFKVLIDCANGSNSYIAKQVLTDLGCNVTSINDNPNGTNINNGCGSTHLEMLKAEIVKDKYDIGFAFDGDADRVLAVSANGEDINGDIIMYILSKYLKNHNQLTNDTLVVTGYSNVGLHKALNKLNIKTDIVANGDKYVLESMLKNDFALGGEQTGHIIIKKDCNFGDGLKSALGLLNALIDLKVNIDDIRKEVTIYPQLLINQKVKDKKVVLDDKDIAGKIEEIKKLLDGNGQILVRPSGTEPLIRVMVEAETNDLCSKYVNEVISLIKEKGYAE